MAAGVLLVALPALVLGARGFRQHSGRTRTDDRTELVLLLGGRALALVLLVLLSAVVLVASVGAVVRDLTVPSLVYVFFVLDLLIAVLVMLTFARPARRRARRPASPAQR